MKPLVFIAGPYTHPDPIDNVHRAIAVAQAVEATGCAVIIPHLSMLWHLVAPQPIDVWYRRDLDVLEHCDALVRFTGPSTGADNEMRFAHRQSIPVFTSELGPGFYTWRASFATGRLASIAGDMWNWLENLRPHWADTVDGCFIQQIIDDYEQHAGISTSAKQL